MLDAIAASGAKPWYEQSVEDARQCYRDAARAAAGRMPEMAEVRDVSMACEGRVLAGRMYRPRQTTSDGCLIYFHGGVFVLGGLDSHEATCRGLAESCGLTVIAVAYRKAPEHPFPAAVDDALDSVRWVHDNAEDLSVDPLRLFVSGDSAGGGLAAVCAHECGDLLAGQILIYPTMDAAMTSASYRTYAEGYRLTAATMAWGYDLWLNGRELIADPRVSPLRHEDLSEVIPTLVVLADCDPLYDEGQAYAARLQEAGVAVEVVVFEGMVHGFVNAPAAIDRSAEALAWIGKRIRAMAA